MTSTIAVRQVWTCPNCGKEARTQGPWLPNRFHVCPKLHGITAPMVPAGTRAKVELREREDYVGKEVVTLDDRRKPVMAVVTTRDDGQDTAVFAPLATSRVDG